MASRKEKAVNTVVKAGLTIGFTIGKFGLLIPFTRRRIYEKMKKTSYANSYDDFKDSIFSKEMYKHCVQIITYDIFKTAKLNQTLPNLQLYKHCFSKDPVLLTLSSIQRKDVPLVLNFGSCS